MAADAGSGALGVYGWIAVAAGVTAATAGGLYFAGVIGPTEVAKTEVAVDAASAEQTPETSVSTDADTAQTTEAKDEQVVVSEPAPEEPAALQVPSLDQIRIEVDGQALLAGRAAANSRLIVLLDGTEIVSNTVDTSGQFAHFLNIPFSDGQRVLTLRSELGEQVAFSDDYFIAALPEPAPEPVQIAQAEQAPKEPVAEPIAEDVAQSETAPQAAPEPQEIKEGEAEQVEQTDVAEIASAEPKEALAEITEDKTPETPKVELAETVSSALETNEAVQAAAEPAAQVADEGGEQVAMAEVSEPEVTEVQPEPVVAEASSEPAPVASTASSETTAEIPEPKTAPVAVETVEAQTPSEDVAVATDANAAEPDIDQPETAAPANENGANTDTAPKAAPSKPVILRSNADGVQLVQAPDAEQARQLALDTIGYSDQGEVQLTGRSKSGAVIRVYLNNNTISDLLADNDGRWRGELSDIAPGIYTLRLDELDQQGVVLSRLETPFKREAPEVLLPETPENVAGSSVPAPAIRAVTVQEGDTLWAISRERYGDGVLFVKVFEANKDHIRDPDLIYPGQVFKIPE